MQVHSSSHSGQCRVAADPYWQMECRLELHAEVLALASDAMRGESELGLI